MLHVLMSFDVLSFCHARGFRGKTLLMMQKAIDDLMKNLEVEKEERTHVVFGIYSDSINIQGGVGSVTGIQSTLLTLRVQTTISTSLLSLIHI